MDIMSNGSPHGMETMLSPQFDQIVTALAAVQSLLENPVKNQTVTISSRRTGRTFSFKYADLASILELVRKPLAIHGLVVVQLLNGAKLTTLLLHASGQWIRSELDVQLVATFKGGEEDADTIKALGGSITYLRRYTLLGLLGLAADDDNDTGVPDDRNRGVDARKVADAPHPVIGYARQVAQVQEGVDLLRYWLTQRGDVERLRLRKDQEALWLEILSEVSGALQRSLGSTVAVAWKSFQIATTREQEKAARGCWDGVWADTLAAFRAAEPEGWANLVRHINAAGERIAAAAAGMQTGSGTNESTRPGGVAGDTGPLQSGDGHPQAGDLAGSPAAVGEDGETPMVPAEEPVPPQSGPRPFAYHLLDAQGEVASDRIADAVLWAEAFAEMYRRSDETERENLEHHNTDALSAADHAVGAQVILLELFERPDQAGVAEPTDEELRAERPMNRGNVLDVIAYLRAIERSLGLVRTRGQMERWLALNEISDDLPGATKLRILKLVAAKKRALGFPLPGPDQAA